MDKSHVQWCRDTFNAMANNATWCVPRSGLVLCRQGDKLVLVGMVPPKLPISRNDQFSDFENLKRHFNIAGIEVISGPIDNEKQIENLKKLGEMWQRGEEGWK